MADKGGLVWPRDDKAICMNRKNKNLPCLQYLLPVHLARYDSNRKFDNHLAICSRRLQSLGCSKQRENFNNTTNMPQNLSFGTSWLKGPSLYLVTALQEPRLQINFPSRKEPPDNSVSNGNGVWELPFSFALSSRNANQIHTPRNIQQIFLASAARSSNN